MSRLTNLNGISQQARKRRKISQKLGQPDGIKSSRREQAARSSGIESIGQLPLAANGVDKPFDDILEKLLPELLDAAAVAQVEHIAHDETVGQRRYGDNYSFLTKC